MQGMFFIPALDLDIYLMNAEFTALRVWLTQKIQMFLSRKAVASLELSSSQLKL